MSEDLLDNWIKNFTQNIANEHIIYIDNENVDSFAERKFPVYELSNLNQKIVEKNKNLIIIRDKCSYILFRDNSLKSLLLKRGIIYIESSKVFLDRLHNKKDDYNKNDFLFAHMDIQDLLSQENMIDTILMRQRIIESIFNKKINFLEDSDKRIKYQEIIEIDFLKEHIDIYFASEKEILTAKLANFIYKICTVNYDDTSTFIGRFLYKELRQKSKTFTFKMLRQRSKKNLSIAYDRFSAFKAYDFNIDRDLELKKKIAQKLLALSNSKKLDVHTIAEVTELSLKEVEKLLKKVNINFRM